MESTLLPQAETAPMDLETVSRSYVAIFTELFTLAARDVFFVSLKSEKSCKSAKRTFEELFGLFGEAYLDHPGELDAFAPEERAELKALVQHGVFSNTNFIHQAIVADYFYFVPQVRDGSPKSGLLRIAPRALKAAYRFVSNKTRGMTKAKSLQLW